MAEGTVLTIILNYRTPDMTLEAAEAALVGMEGISGEILIIDNGSADGSYEILCAAAQERGWLSDGRLSVVGSPVNGGFGAGCNIGIKTVLADGSRPDFYYLLNSDAFVQRDTIRILRDFLQRESLAGLAGSRVVGVDGEPHTTAFRFPSIAGEFVTAARTGLVTRLLENAVVPMGMPTEQIRLDWTAGASLMIRREVIEEVGAFDETFFLYYEETDLCHRALRAGWQTWYLPDSEVAHVGSASTGMKNWPRIPQYWLDSRLHYFAKTRGGWYAGAATLARAAGGLLYGIRRLVSDKPQVDPPQFLRDIMSHAICALFSRKAHQAEVISPYTPIPEKPE
jgi:N-acetylglucosaminyl-diphospho-decaprenol L-rhamnosyltransferase